MKEPVFYNVEQNTEEWTKLRCGVLTASEVHQLITPKLKIADNETTKMLVFQKAAERLTGIKEETFIGLNGIRGHEDEVLARELYADRYDVELGNGGFIVRDFDGFKIGYSPDALMLFGSGGIECKSRQHKHHIKVVCSDEIPGDHLMQLQTGLLVAGLDYIDYISYSGGLPLWVKRCVSDSAIQELILQVANAFEKQVNETMEKFSGELLKQKHLVKTDYVNYRELEQIR
jgi:hypothetical protein